MRKCCFLLALAAVGAAQAQVTPSAWFSPPLIFQENFDTIPSGPYLAVGVLGFPAFAYRTTPGGWLSVAPPVGPNPPAFSPANTMMGVNSGVGIQIIAPMRRFGGYFRTNINTAGLANTNAKIVFYSQSGNVIGSVGINLSPVWTQFAWQTNPRWTHVEIYGGPFGPGGVEMDSVWVRPN